MRNNLFLIQLLFIATVWLSSCGRQTAAPRDGGDTVAFRYAKRLTVVRHDGYTEVTLVNPWHEGKVLHRYVLVPRDSELPAHMPTATVIRTPLQRSIVFTTVHCALLQMLHQERHIAGVADLKYIKIPYVHQMVSRGKMIDVGDGMSPVIERIIDLQPDAILLSPFENSGGYGRLEDIDIPIVECAEYMEPTPLARAEWMRFYGMLYGCEQQADSLFAVVDSSYHALKNLAKKHQSQSPTDNAELHADNRKSVLLDKVTGSVWYVPGGRSTIGQMIVDAGGSYVWSDDEHSGSVSLPFETVLEKAGDNRFWLFRFSSDHLISYSELLGEHRGYNQFRAFRERNVYGCNVEKSLFYEESPFRPDWLLTDFIHILHPDIPNLPPLRYYEKLKE
jgi:iron complex transport system substrate-binding protein